MTTESRTERPFLVIGQQRGPRNARTDPASGVRYYEWLGRWLPSVTTIRALAGVPRRLHEDALTQVVNRALERASDYAQRLQTANPEELVKCRTELRAAATEKRDRRGAFGTAVHEAIESGRGLAAVGPDLAPRLRQFLAWQAASGVEIVGSELQVFNLEVGYAGSIDAICRFPDGSTWVVDWKTGGDDLSEGIYPDQLLQLLPDLMAEFVGADDVRDDAATALLHEATGIGILHLVDGASEFRSLEATPGAWRAFRGLLEYAMWSVAHQDMDSVTLGKRRFQA